MQMVDKCTLHIMFHEEIARLIRGVGAAVISREKICRVEVPFEATPLLWLYNQPHRCKFYWSSRDNGLEMAAVGIADEIHVSNKNGTRDLFGQISKRLSFASGECRYFGGIRFQPGSGDGSWKAFGEARFILPLFEFSRQAGRSLLAYHWIQRGGDTIESVEKKLAFELDQLNLSLVTEIPSLDPVPARRENVPTRDTWINMVERALDHLSHSNLDKVVLARRSDFHSQDAINPFAVMKGLKGLSGHCFHFILQSDDSVFMGASPELLYARKGREITSEALAGTRPRGKTATDDIELENELLHSRKDGSEHRFVEEAIRESLTQLCEGRVVDTNTQVMKLSHVQHLHHRFVGKLRPDVSDGEVVASLHPTPAVGGWPKGEALRRINELEVFDRGFYAAPVGCLSAEAAEFSVAIRSALISGPTMSLFSGAGIVKGSDPVAEWNEVESKISHYKEILGNPS